MKKIAFFLALFAVSAIFVGCGPRLVKGPATEFEVAAPDSLKAKFSIEVHDSIQGDHTLSGVLFAVPYKRYRLEFSGPMGIGLASMLWADGDWKLVLSGQKTYAEGKGYLVGGYAGIPLFDIHQIAALFWGDAMPHGATIDSTAQDSSGQKIYGTNALGLHFVATRNSEGRISEISQGSEKLELSDYAEFGSRVAASKAQAFRNGKNVLNIQLKSVKTDAEWGEGTWRLPIPEKYQRLDY